MSNRITDSVFKQPVTYADGVYGASNSGEYKEIFSTKAIVRQ